MKTQPFKGFSKSKIDYVVNAVALEQVKAGAEDKCLSIAFNKLKSQRNNAELDSMEMILLARALKRLYVRLYKEYGEESFKKERQHLLNIANKIDIARLQHQENNHPLKKHKKILTA
ncbi:hypothetical protein FLK61_26010 [Paenalkalicoccus suaedae]|uniref:Uncharacterized protein n=1 Tax=Paenalkalicoccus suaedae TaxID=2592382 RepID=A0A859FAF5_9BACI|nr:hypothetical protein [Paenalkalicoccus suaedae]QKS70219.1 hypothetical protein FLK61_26010 [Paenalkalicoccus suaedae]